MCVNPLFPIKVIETETKDIFYIDSLEELVMFVEEFLDILDDDFECFEANSNKLVFTDKFLAANHIKPLPSKSKCTEL